MNYEKIESSVAAILEKGVTPLSLTFPDLFSEVTKMRLKYQCQLDDALLISLVEQLRDEVNISSIFDEKYLNTGTGGAKVSLYSLARWLVVASDEIGTKQAVELLIAYLSLDYSPAMLVLAISGVELNEPISISDSIDLIPFHVLPPSNAKETLSPSFLDKDLMTQYGYVHIPISYRTPKAAIVKKVSLTPRSFANTERRFSAPDYTELFELCDFLTLCPEANPVSAGFWIELDNSVPCKDMLGGAWSCPPPDVLSRNDVLLTQASWDSLAALYQRFAGLSQDSKDLLRIPLQRINQARRRKIEADKAIDQGVAYEALFLNDKPNTEQLSFRFRLRASLFLGENYEQRKELMDFFVAFYKCRSQAAHTGRLDEKVKVAERGRVDTRQLLKESDEHCIAAIMKVINNGGFPDWPRLQLAATS